MIELDGSYGEGGGQLLRMAVALSALSGRHLRLTKIRAGRRNPGLQPQHATAVRVIAALTEAEVEGAVPGSGEILFRPRAIRGGGYHFDVGTAGSLGLVVQACLPVALHAPEPVRLKLVGGTDVRWSPPFDYLDSVIVPLLRRMGFDLELNLHRRGYYPRGGGEVELMTRPTSSVRALGRIDRGEAGSITGRVHTSRLPPDIARRMNRAVRTELEQDGRLLSWPVSLEEQVDGVVSAGPGGAVVLWAECGQVRLGADALAERGTPSERVGGEAARRLLLEIHSGAALDIHAADQLPVYLLLARAPSSYLVREATGHLTTMSWLLPQFLGGRVDITPEGDLMRVECVPEGAT